MADDLLVVSGLHKPLVMTFDARGRLISLQSEQGYTSVRVVWPAGQETVIADRYDGLPFSRPNGVTVDPNTSGQIIALLESLNRDDGLTVVVVTHEAHLFKNATRTVRLEDGRLAAEEEGDA